MASAMRRRFSAGVAALALLAGIVAVLRFVEPVETPGFPRCPVYAMTGLQCPGCGTARALHALASGNPLSALRLNAFLAFVIPILVALAIRPDWSRSVLLNRMILAATISWMILRNVCKLV